MIDYLMNIAGLAPCWIAGIYFGEIIMYLPTRKALYT